MADPLLDAQVWNAPGQPVGFLETHISRLYFVGERVYKVKKAVDYGFLNFTTLAQREYYCTQELLLNRRLAPTVYLAVAPIRRDGQGRLRLRGSGEVAEWAVEMRRLPEERMLNRLLERGEVDNALWQELIATLVRFHANARTGPGVDEYGSLQTITFNARENFEQTRAFCGTPKPGSTFAWSNELHAFLAQRAESFLSTQSELLERRVRSGRIRDGHGDLHAGNICFASEGLAIYDCIEFSERFRCGDVAADLAFLAMDLDHAGLPGFAGWLVKRYARESADPELLRLMPFYKAYRAIVRAKVAALGMAGGGAEQTEFARRQAAAYFQLAASYELAPAVYLMCGLPATGKSLIARELARNLRATLVRSDVRRKVIAGVAPRSHQNATFGRGIYSAEMGERTYRSLLEQSVESLSVGRSIVVDATFARRSQRAPFFDAMTRLGQSIWLLWVEAPEDLVRKRLEHRAHDASEASDADWSVYERARAQFEPPTEVAPELVCRLSTAELAPCDCAGALIDQCLRRPRAISPT